MLIKDLFSLSYGMRKIPFSQQQKGNMRFVSSQGTNRGVQGWVNLPKNAEWAITVPRVGTICQAYFQDKPCICNENVVIMQPKITLDQKTMIYYSLCIRNYKSLFMYGRQVTPERLGELEIPSPDEIPSWVYTMEIPSFDDIVESKTQDQVELPPVKQWKDFKYPDIFILKRGTGGKAGDADKNPGSHPYIGASDQNNGITKYTSLNTTEPANSITVANNGSVGAAFYQSKPYLASSDITVLTLKNYNLTPAIAMFLITLIRQEGEKVNYGRKWGISRMKETIISLPVTEQGEPDWDLMERYINSLPYSKYL